VDQGRPCVCLLRQGFPVGQALQIVAGKGLAGFDLNGDQLRALIEEQIDFMAGRVPPEVEIRRRPPVVVVLQEFRDYPGFEYSSTGGMLASCSGF
jgi:hypothetical protein